MLVRYAAVTLLIAVLSPSAVRAQSLNRGSHPPSSQPKGQGPEVVSVRPQPDSPLRLSVETKWVDQHHYVIAASVENVSGRDVGAYALRHTLGGERPGSREWNIMSPGIMVPGRVLRPGQSAMTGTWRGLSSTGPVRTYGVDSVVFTDGTTWCADVCHTAERMAGYWAGGRASLGRLQELLEGGGPDAVMKEVKEGLGDVAPPPEHSPAWEEGFRMGTKAMAERVWREFELYGPGQIERMLKRPYDAAGAK